MGPREALGRPFESHVGINVPQQRKLGSQPYLPQMRPPSAPSNGSGIGGPGLQFMSFDVSYAPNSFPPPPSGAHRGTVFGAFEDEPSLLEELGINTNLIMRKTRAILNPLRVNPDLHEDPDLSGPFVFFMLFGLSQLLAGKIHFGVILGWMWVASLFLYVVFNLLAGRNGVLALYRCLSLIGYCLLPMLIFSALSLFIPRQGLFATVFATLAVIWCTRACTSLLVVVAPHADEHRSLVAYACCLIYTAFALLVVF